MGTLPLTHRRIIGDIMACHFRFRCNLVPWLLAGILAVLPPLAVAHPHAWIDLRVRVLTNDQGEVRGLEQEWLFDPYYSQIVLEDLGGEVSAPTQEAWLTAIAARILENLAAYRYFTTIEQDGEPVPDLSSGAHALSAERDRLRLRFELLLPRPYALSAAPFSYAIADPTYYIEMLHEDGLGAIRVESGSLDCHVALQPPNPPLALIARAAALAIHETGDPDLGQHFAEWVHIRCT